jgi:hypothetical protein
VQDRKTARRIDLSKCKLLSTYGQNPGSSPEATVKVGGIKTGVKVGLSKPGIA